MGRMYLRKVAFDSYEEIDRLFLPEFTTHLEFYTDPESFSKKNTTTKEEIQKKKEQIIRAKRKREILDQKKKEKEG